ncbi:hypothetical protein [Phenylobacterium deserti]|uniref:Uncharacterized protein n=1 Tax=Phenylobacterium deserti TaxID=1914756 RepID=A0A328AU28_9CAUL|nr:hypothetical protein [Phenylobacterium deserti]RAK57024.1 hypothetical protein DJ018_03425 [Phenylobacterium deserti]
MSRTIMPAAASFPAEFAHIGRLVVGYGELEFSLVGLAEAVTGVLVTPLRVLFRVRSESQRLDLADALIRPSIDEKLRPQYEKVLSDLRYCLQIRNQFAHAHWASEGNRLNFTHLEGAAKRNDAEARLTLRYVDLSLLEQQEAFFVYVDDCLFHLTDASAELASRPLGHDGLAAARPRPLKRPALFVAS